LPYSNSLYADPYCGNFSRETVPLDYTNPEHRRSKLAIVEDYHFSKNVENLITGDTGAIGSDIDFTLRAFPNHHRALVAMSKLSIRDKTQKPRGANYSIICYFDRAIRFKPDDATVRLVFSEHLLKTDKFDMALEQLNIASKLEPNNATISYNLGLLYFQKKNYDKAEHFARKAYSLGFPLPGLKNKLTSVGKWTN
jgi:tetratricopeptide (TPR) repeat protein